MADALAKYRAALKRYRKDHPNIPFAKAQKAVSAAMHSGKKISGGKRKNTATVPKKRSVIKTERITTIGSRKRKSSGSGLGDAVAISRQIEGLELVLKNTRGVQAKNVVKRRINALHDRLDLITGKLKSA